MKGYHVGKIQQIRRIAALCLAVAFTLPLAGCSSNKEWMAREVLREPLVLEFYTCWSVTDARGAELKRLVENFNLQHYDDLSVQLVTVSGREDYNARIRTLSAANRLPALFMLADTPENAARIASDRLADLECDGAIAGGRLLPVGYSRMMLYRHGSDQNVTGLDPGPLLAQEQRGEALFALCVPYGSGPACDLLFALCQSAYTQPDLGELEESLTAWRAIMERSAGVGGQAYDRMSVIQLWVGGEADYLLEEEEVLGLTLAAPDGVVPLLVPQGVPLHGELWGVAAAGSLTAPEKAASAVFLDYLQREMNPRIFTSTEPGRVLYSRLLTVEQQEELSAVLERYLQSERELAAAAAYLASLPVWEKDA